MSSSDGLLAGGGRARVVMSEVFDVSAGFKFAAGSNGSSLRNVSVDHVPIFAARVFPGVSGVTVEANVFRTGFRRLGGH